MQQNGLFSSKYSVLVYQQIQKRLCWQKKINYLMRWLFDVFNCKALTFPLKQIINDEKRYRVNHKQNMYNKIRPA